MQNENPNKSSRDDGEYFQPCKGRSSPSQRSKAKTPQNPLVKPQEEREIIMNLVENCEYHLRLGLKLDDQVRSGNKPETEDICGAVAALMALGNTGLQITDDMERLNWLDAECRAGRVMLSINHIPRGTGNTARGAIDDAMNQTSANKTKTGGK